ncbi:MAG: hypothetical protein EVA65_15685 [Oceanococcus sp.]|nr:MAG: hypothetical protein EVA65_15685 [Oceanococcus sp.]
MREDMPDADAKAQANDAIAGGEDWLGRAREAYHTSTDWLNASLSAEWQRNLSHFQGRHAPGSKYGTEAYKNRSKVFRPKPRSMVRTHEAAFAAAMFSNADLISVTPEDPDSPENAMAAELHKGLLQRRLTKDIPWFQTAVGAYQDTKVLGEAIAHLYWRFEEEEFAVPVPDPATGAPMFDEDGLPVVDVRKRIVVDKPVIDLIDPNNFRFDPSADWRDPINTSPYLIRLVPVHRDSLASMFRNSRSVKWIEGLDPASFSASNKEEYDAVKNERDHNRKDTEDSQPKAYDIVWLHENIVEVDGDDVIYWTEGTSRLISEPQPLEEVYLAGVRPFVLGYSNIEAHRTHPQSDVSVTSGLTEATNDIANQRLDNVRLAIDKRYILRRGQQIDVEALMRNVPGGGVVTDDPDGDIRVVTTPDVTASSYQEQDRFDVQFDELAGSFSQSSVANNRQLNETVGGMQLMQAGASAIGEYSVRVFVETWVEPVLRQLIKLERTFETDENIVRLAGEAEGIFKRYNVETITDNVWTHEVDVTVNVGIGATNPMQRVERLMTGINTAMNLPGAAERIEADEVIKEVFGALGYKNGSRFFMDLEAYQEKMQGQEPPADPAIKKLELEAAAKNREAQIREAELMQRSQMDQMRMQLDAAREQDRMALDREIKFAELALKERLTLAELRAKLELDGPFKAQQLALEAEKIQTMRDTTALKETNRQNEMDLKRSMGSGI